MVAILYDSLNNSKSDKNLTIGLTYKSLEESLKQYILVICVSLGQV